MRLPILCSLAVALAVPGAAQTAAGHRVTVEVPATESLAVSAEEVVLVFEAPAPGEPFADATDASARYAVTTNTTGNKITGELSGAFPDGLRVAVALAAPPGAASLGPVELGEAPHDLVAGVSTTAASGLGITYTASITDEAALGGPLRESRTVTFTLTDQ